MSDMEAINAKAGETLAAVSTEQLFEMLDMLDREPKIEHYNLVHAWIATEIERRHDVDAYMNAWADDPVRTETYAQALRAAVSQEAA